MSKLQNTLRDLVKIVDEKILDLRNGVKNSVEILKEFMEKVSQFKDLVYNSESTDVALALNIFLICVAILGLGAFFYYYHASMRELGCTISAKFTGLKEEVMSRFDSIEDQSSSSNVTSMANPNYGKGPKGAAPGRPANRALFRPGNINPIWSPDGASNLPVPEGVTDRSVFTRENEKVAEETPAHLSPEPGKSGCSRYETPGSGYEIPNPVITRNDHVNESPYHGYENIASETDETFVSEEAMDPGPLVEVVEVDHQALGACGVGVQADLNRLSGLGLRAGQDEGREETSGIRLFASENNVSVLGATELPVIIPVPRRYTVSGKVTKGNKKGAEVESSSRILRSDSVRLFKK